ncbi:MAG: Ig-like domain-containing domain, partial [Limisphaerales bacterium]
MKLLFPRSLCASLCLLVAHCPAADPALQIEALSAGRYRLAWPAADAGYVLEGSPAVGAGAAWTPAPATPQADGARLTVTVVAGADPRFYRLVRLPVLPARVAATSPAAGETGVSVNRESVFRFDAPLAGDTVLDTTLVSARAAGRTLLTRVELATDRRSAALFYLEPLPPGTRVTARLDGFGILDAAGRALDADADGLPGGVLEVPFTTASATPVGSTAVLGRVLASEKNPDGTDRPLAGVTITVDGAEQTLRAVTGADGAFVLQPAPAGRFFVHVDGRTSPLSQWPGGAYYPFVGKAWEAAPGRTNNLANGDGLIFLPLVAADALRPVSATETTVVTFPPSLLAMNPAFVGVEVRVPPNALFADSGTRGGQVGLAPVAPDRLPEPLPPGLNLPLVITIQTDGPSNFDRPVPVRFPNLPDPVTGVTLPPGAKTALWSFDHDTGRWEIAGPMTVTADGFFAET